MLNLFKKKNKYVYVNNKLLNNINIPILFDTRNEAKEEMNRIIKEIEG